MSIKEWFSIKISLSTDKIQNNNFFCLSKKSIEVIKQSQNRIRGSRHKEHDFLREINNKCSTSGKDWKPIKISESKKKREKRVVKKMAWINKHTRTKK